MEEGRTGKKESMEERMGERERRRQEENNGELFLKIKLENNK